MPSDVGKLEQHWRVWRNLCFLRPTRVPILYNGRPFPPKLPLLMRIWTPSNLWFLAPFWAHNPKGITIGSAVFAQMTAECPHTLQWAPIFPKKCHLAAETAQQRPIFTTDAHAVIKQLSPSIESLTTISFITRERTHTHTRYTVP